MPAVLLLLAALAFEDMPKEIPPDIALFFQERESHRDHLRDYFEEELTRRKKNRSNDADIRKSLKLIEIEDLAFPLKTLEKGSLGYLHDSKAVVVNQILDQDSALVTHTFSFQTDNGVSYAKKQFLVRGISTESLTDNDATTLKQCFRVAGTTSFATAGGAKRTVLLLEVFDVAAAEKYRAAWNAKMAAEKARMIESKKAESRKKPEVNSSEDAASKLKQARALLDKNPTAARKRLQEIIDKFPETEAAIEAAKLLEK